MPLLALGLLAVSLIWYLLLILLYSLFLRFLWSEVPQFLRSIKPPKRKRNLLFSWGISTIAILIGSVPFSLPLFHLYPNYPTAYNKVLLKAMSRQVLERIFGSWYVTAAYLYHFTSLLRPKSKSKNSPPNKKNH